MVRNEEIISLGGKVPNLTPKGPLRIVRQVIHFALINGSGVALMLGATWLLTEFAFGHERYFIGYSVGVALSLAYSFALNTAITFGTKSRHGIRFAAYVAYNLSLAGVQVLAVRLLTPIVGERYYLAVIASVVAVLSVGSFLLYRSFLFNENRSRAGTGSR